MNIVYDPVQWEQSLHGVKAMREAMPDGDAPVYTIHSAEEAREKFFCGRGGDEGVCGAISYEAGSLSAYKLVIGLLKLCLEKGLNLQTHTPALGLEKIEGGGWKIETNRGSICAKKVVLATNGYTAHLWKKFQGVIVPLRGHVTAQRPGMNMPKEGLPVTYSFIYKEGYDYMIQRPKGSKFEDDIVIGGALMKGFEGGLEEYGTTDDTVFDGIIIEALHESLPRYFGDSWGVDNPEGRLRLAWTGIMGYSPDGLPFVGEMPGEKDLWVSCSFQGHGMVLCWMCARALVTMMEGQGKEEELKKLDSWFPEIFKITEERMRLTFHGRLH